MKICSVWFDHKPSPQLYSGLHLSISARQGIVKAWVGQYIRMSCTFKSGDTANRSTTVDEKKHTLNTILNAPGHH